MHSVYRALDAAGASMKRIGSGRVPGWRGVAGVMMLRLRKKIWYLASS